MSTPASAPSVATYRWRGRNHALAHAGNKYLVSAGLHPSLLAWAPSPLRLDSHRISACPSDDAYACLAACQVDSLVSQAGEVEDRPRFYAAYKLAVESISRYPLPLTSAAEAGDLVGIGDFIAQRIGRILRLQPQQQRAAEAEGGENERLAQAGADSAASSTRKRKRTDGAPQSAAHDTTGERRAGGGSHGAAVVDSSLGEAAAVGRGGSGGGEVRRPRRRYTPKQDSAACQLLLALISLLGAPDSAAVAAGATVSVTALFRHVAALFPTELASSSSVKSMAAVKKLAKQALIARHTSSETEASSERVSLTQLGAAACSAIVERQRLAVPSPSPAAEFTAPLAVLEQLSPEQPSSPPVLAISAASAPPLQTLLPFSLFTLHLALDTRERRLHSHPQLPPDSLVRSLPAGDFVWLLRHAVSGEEYVVDCIVERKRVGDLAMSVKDGRMKEQRWRMKRSNMTRKLYIIEGDIPAASAQAAGEGAEAAVHHAIPSSTLESVLSSLSTVHGYSVVRTSGVSWTVGVLRELHRQLEQDMREEGVLLRERYGQFEERMKKRGAISAPHRVDDSADGAEGEGEEEDKRQVWGSQLRMIRGISPMTAASIVALYPTLAALRRAYSESGSRVEEELLLADITRGQRKTKIGHELSRRVREVLRLKAYDMAEWAQLAADRESEAEQQRRDKQQKLQAREEERQARKRQQAEQKKERAQRRRDGGVGVQSQSTEIDTSERREEKDERLAGEALLREGRKEALVQQAAAAPVPAARSQNTTQRTGNKRGVETGEEAVGSRTASLTLEQASVECVAVQAQDELSSGGSVSGSVVQLSVDDEAVLRAMRRRVAMLEQCEQRQLVSLLDDELDVTAGESGAVRKPTAKERSRQRSTVSPATAAKRSRPRRGVIQLSSDEDVELQDSASRASGESGDVQCWTADLEVTEPADVFELEVS